MYASDSSKKKKKCMQAENELDKGWNIKLTVFDKLLLG